MQDQSGQAEHRIEARWHRSEAKAAAVELDAVLRSRGITIAPGSPLEAHLLEAIRLADWIEDPTVEPEGDIRAMYRSAMGVHELATAVLAALCSEESDSLVPHLRLLGEGSALQNQPSGIRDQATNKLFELLVATWGLRCGTDLALDDPRSSDGTNPDVLITIDGVRWGIACKVPHSQAPKTLYDNLEKGVQQIEASEAEVGIVILNLKNVFPHDLIWPEVDSEPVSMAVWDNPTEPYGMAMKYVEELGSEMLAGKPQKAVDLLFRQSKSLPAFGLWASSATAYHIDDGVGVSTVRALQFFNWWPLSDLATSVLDCLNRAALGRG